MQGRGARRCVPCAVCCALAHPDRCAGGGENFLGPAAAIVIFSGDVLPVRATVRRGSGGGRRRALECRAGGGGFSRGPVRGSRSWRGQRAGVPGVTFRGIFCTDAHSLRPAAELRGPDIGRCGRTCICMHACNMLGLPHIPRHALTRMRRRAPPTSRAHAQPQADAAGSKSYRRCS